MKPSAVFSPEAPKPLFSYRPYWAKRFGIAPYLPMSRAEMEALGWDSCDVILVTGDAYVDHPSFGMALVGRLLEAQGFRVGIISQPDWHSAADFRKLGLPSTRKACADSQSGGLMMPTRKPCASSSRPTSAIPKLGWSI